MQVRMQASNIHVARRKWLFVAETSPMADNIWINVSRIHVKTIKRVKNLAHFLPTLIKIV